MCQLLDGFLVETAPQTTGAVHVLMEKELARAGMYSYVYIFNLAIGIGIPVL